MHIDFLIGDNPYGSTVHFAKGLSKALERLDVKTRLFWIDDGHFFHAFYAIQDDPPDLTCSFSDITADGRSLNELWNIPHLSILLDPAIYFLHQLKGDRGWASCVDAGDCRFLHSLGFSKSFVLPHGVEAALKTPIDQLRPYDTVFFGSCIDYEEVEASWKEKYGAQAHKTLFEAAERVLSPEGISILQALIDLGAKEIDLPLFHHEVDLYTRGKDRVCLIRSFKGAHVWGSGPWEKYIQTAAIHPPIPFEETIEIMKQAKIVLNSSPRFKEGFHERIFYALLCGSMPVTGQSAWIEKHFKVGEELATYTYGNWENRVEVKNAAQIAAKGQERVWHEHTWDVRAGALKEAVFGGSS